MSDTSITIVLDEQTHFNMGSRSLVGKVGLAKEVLLVFPQTSMEYRKKHGPNQWFIPEYVMMCILEDVLFLTSQGVSISIKEVPFFTGE